MPANITLLTLPPYSDDACCDAWNALITIPKRVASITSRDWAKVSG